ncbi:MAG: hypothetical protein WAM47_01765 [Candidatus Sulfotelmatobacter sp.]
MTRAQRAVLVLYCLLVAYCCVWVPWQFTARGVDYQLGYALIGGCGPVSQQPADDNKYEVVDENGKKEPPKAVPCDGFQGGLDVRAVALRLLAATALCGGLFVATGKWKPA